METKTTMEIFWELNPNAEYTYIYGCVVFFKGMLAFIFLPLAV